MTVSIPDLIAQRRQALEAERKALLDRLAPIQAELRKYASVEKVLNGTPGRSRRRKSLGRQRPTPDSIQGYCLAAIEAQPGMKPKEIMAWISVHRSVDFARSSFAPQLSRLRKEGWIENRNGTYFAVPDPGAGPG